MQAESWFVLDYFSFVVSSRIYVYCLIAPPPTEGGDVCTIMRVHAFLEQWGLINYTV